MARSRTETMLTRRFLDGASSRTPDELIVEEPLAIQLDGVLVSSTMRTPGHDFELAAGFLLAEGALGGASITTIRYCGSGSAVDSEFNVVTVETGGLAPAPTPRLGSISSSCGSCGIETVGELTERLRVLGPYEPWDPAVLTALPQALREHQPLFEATGGSHGAAVADRSGRIVVAREDIGRHNAVDKVIGRLLLDGRLPAAELALVVSGRGSFEMVQKAWVAGLTAIVSVSAPSALAVATARRAGATLLGFARDGSGNLYSPQELA